MARPRCLLFLLPKRPGAHQQPATLETSPPSHTFTQVMMPWIMAQWEEYHTGVMMYGTKYYGVLEVGSFSWSKPQFATQYSSCTL